MKKQPLYQIDEVGKTLLVALKKCGRRKTFAQVLEEVGVTYTNEKQSDLANTLEALGLIESVTYRLPFEIRGQLSLTGLELVSKMESESKKGTASGSKNRDKTDQIIQNVSQKHRSHGTSGNA